jgi:hypothetical protein
MTRKMIIALALMVLIMILAGVMALALMPIWLPILLIKPALMNPARDAVVAKVMQNVAKAMFSRSKVIA